MNIKRIVTHWLTTRGQVKRAFPPETLNKIEHAIQASETAHVGEICFVVEGALDGSALLTDQSARERSIEVFSQQRVWDTEFNNGLLIYVLLADRAVEIVADRGIDAKVGPQAWDTICHQMEAAFRQSDFESGVLQGVQTVTKHLVAHFPAGGDNRNELPDMPVLL